MITIKKEEDIVRLRKAGKILAAMLVELSKKTLPGVSTLDIDNYTNELCKKYGVVPVFLNYKPYGASRPFPASICVSINDEIVHGIPNETPRTFKEGDIVSLDMGVSYEGMIVDSATTVGVGKIDEAAQRLLDTTRGSLKAGIKAAVSGSRTGDIGFAVEDFVNNESKIFAEKTGLKKIKPFGIAENLGGHGVGYEVHEDPFVPNFGKKNQGPILKPGMVIAIEPMLNEGTDRIMIGRDGWVYQTLDGKRSAHFEHTVLITDKGPEILTA